MAPMRNILSYSWNKVPSRREIHINCTTETCTQCSIIIFGTPSKWSSTLWLKPSKKPSRQILRCRRSVPEYDWLQVQCSVLVTGQTQLSQQPEGLSFCQMCSSGWQQGAGRASIFGSGFYLSMRTDWWFSPYTHTHANSFIFTALNVISC